MQIILAILSYGLLTTLASHRVRTIVGNRLATLGAYTQLAGLVAYDAAARFVLYLGGVILADAAIITIAVGINYKPLLVAVFGLNALLGIVLMYAAYLASQVASVAAPRLRQLGAALWKVPTLFLPIKLVGGVVLALAELCNSAATMAQGLTRVLAGWATFFLALTGFAWLDREYGTDWLNPFTLAVGSFIGIIFVVMSVAKRVSPHGRSLVVSSFGWLAVGTGLVVLAHPYWDIDTVSYVGYDWVMQPQYIGCGLLSLVAIYFASKAKGGGHNHGTTAAANNPFVKALGLIIVLGGIWGVLCPWWGLQASSMHDAAVREIQRNYYIAQGVTVQHMNNSSRPVRDAMRQTGIVDPAQVRDSLQPDIETGVQLDDYADEQVAEREHRIPKNAVAIPANLAAPTPVSPIFAPYVLQIGGQIGDSTPEGQTRLADHNATVSETWNTRDKVLPYRAFIGRFVITGKDGVVTKTEWQVYHNGQVIGCEGTPRGEFDGWFNEFVEISGGYDLSKFYYNTGSGGAYHVFVKKVDAAACQTPPPALVAFNQGGGNF